MMKSKTICFAALTIVLIVAGYICLSGFIVKNNYSPLEPATTLSYSPLNPDSVFAEKHESYDTLPVKYKKTDPSSSLLKLIANVFRFRKFAQINEKNRVIDLLNQLNIGDSIAATQQNVAFLNKYLTDTVNQNIDSLYSLIHFLQVNNDSLYAGIDYLNSSQSQIQGKMKDLEGYKLEYEKMGKDKYANMIASGENLNRLASKIFPIVLVSSDIKEVSEKMSRINTLKNIRDSISVVREKIDTAGNKQYYRVGVKNKIEVYGFYNYTTKGRVQASNLGYINTLVYNALQINTNGDVNDLNGWDTSNIVSQAQNAGCSVALSFGIANPQNIHDFLNNQNARASFIKTAIYLIKFRNASMINISFGSFLYEDSKQFFYFIKDLSSKLKQQGADYKFLITVPAIFGGGYYPLSELAPVTDRIIIDFSTNYSQTASPLSSMPALKEIIPSFINAKVQAEKIVVCLPYHGIKWGTINFYPPKFIEYINYEVLRKNYQLFPGYINRIDTGLVVSVMESINKNRDTVGHIFYDDESTLGLKYNFILEGKLKGVAVNALGEDYGYASLWDEMSYAFAMPDTAYISGVAKRRLVKEEGLGFFQKLYRKLSLYNYILQNPCEICFENIKDSAKNEQVQQYLLDLDIYTKMKAANLERIKNGETPFRSQFQFVNSRLVRAVFIITMLLIIVLLALGLIYFLKTKANGDSWDGKKIVTRLLLVDSVLIILFLFTFLFCNDNIMFFGSAGSDKGGYSKDYAADNNAPGITTSTTSDYCVKDPETDCINMPLQTLLAIIILGLIVGGILTRYLLLPLIKRYEKP